jgi:hypothetical protein
MINLDGTKGIKPVNYLNAEKWDSRLKVERHETRDDGDQSDAKNRQKTSYEEILVLLLDTLKGINETGQDFSANV